MGQWCNCIECVGDQPEPTPEELAADEARKKVERMQELCWQTFSERFNFPSPSEMERSERLQLEWKQWQFCWRSAIEAHIGVMLWPN